MYFTMRYNDFKHDPLSRCEQCNPPYSACNAIAARNDLNPANGNKHILSKGNKGRLHSNLPGTHPVSGIRIRNSIVCARPDPCIKPRNLKLPLPSRSINISWSHSYFDLSIVVAKLESHLLKLGWGSTLFECQNYRRQSPKRAPPHHFLALLLGRRSGNTTLLGRWPFTDSPVYMDVSEPYIIHHWGPVEWLMLHIFYYLLRIIDSIYPGTYPFRALGHRSHGATDVKITSAYLRTSYRFLAICSPTHNISRGIPPFKWVILFYIKTRL